MMTPADERRLVDQARAGNAQAFGELALAHQTFVYNLALRALGDPNEAQDISQEAFLRAWRGLPSFRGASGFRTWLYRIVMNLCYNRSPQLKHALQNLSLDADPAGAALEEWLPSPRPSPEGELEASEQRALLHRLINGLPPTYRLLTLLRYNQELSYEEIAEATGMPLGTVKTGLHRAHAALRAALLNAGAPAQVELSVKGN